MIVDTGQTYGPRGGYAKTSSFINSSTTNRGNNCASGDTPRHYSTSHGASQQYPYQYSQLENGFTSNERDNGECISQAKQQYQYYQYSQHENGITSSEIGNRGCSAQLEAKQPHLHKQLAFDQPTRHHYTVQDKQNDCGQLTSQGHNTDINRRIVNGAPCQNSAQEQINSSGQNHTLIVNHHGGVNGCEESNLETMRTQHYRNGPAKAHAQSQNASMLGHQTQVSSETIPCTDQLSGGYGNYNEERPGYRSSNHDQHGYYYDGDCDGQSQYYAGEESPLKRTHRTENLNAKGKRMIQKQEAMDRSPNASTYNVEVPSQFKHDPSQSPGSSKVMHGSSHYADEQDLGPPDYYELGESYAHHSHKDNSSDVHVHEQGAHRFAEDSRSACGSNPVNSRNSNLEKVSKETGEDVQELQDTGQHKGEQLLKKNAPKPAMATNNLTTGRKVDKVAGTTGRKRSATFPPGERAREKNLASDKDRLRQGGNSKKVRTKSEIPVLAKDHRKSTRLTKQPKASKNVKESTAKSEKEEFSRRLPLPPIGSTEDDGQQLKKSSTVLSKASLGAKSQSDVKRPSTRQSEL